MLKLPKPGKPSRSDAPASILIVPFGNTDLMRLEILREGLRQNLTGIEVKVADPVSIPEGSFMASRNQFLAAQFLRKLLRMLPEEDQSRILGVTDEDLFAPGLNFVFGQAFDRVAVVSTRRLKSPKRSGNSNDILQLRMLKEAVHELGHTFGLKHCTEPFCVMYFSNSIVDTDLKKERFCRKCSTKVGMLVGR